MARLPGLPEVEVALKRSARARRFSLRVRRHDGAVTLTLPLRAREGDALRFLQSQEDWLKGALTRVQPEARLQAGMDLPFEGRSLRLQAAPGRAVRQDGGLLLVPGDPAQIGPRTQAWLKTMARDRLAQAVDRHAAQLGRKVTAMALRDTSSRWGSCSAEGRLMFSWRLIMAPPSVLDYVAAHEVAHLAEMNHSPRFWAVVARLCPGWEAERAWLRREGAALQALRFT